MDDGTGHLCGLLIFVFIMILYAIFSSFEIALSNVSESDLEKRANEGDRKAKAILHLLERTTIFYHTQRAVMVLLAMLTGYILFLVLPGLEPVTAIAVIIGTYLLILIFGYLTPRKIALHHSIKTAYRYYGVIRFFIALFRPIVFVVESLSNIVVRLFGVDPHKNPDEMTEEEIISMVDEAHEQGVIQENEAEMIQNIIEFGDTLARDIMTTRSSIDAIDGSTSLEEALRIMLKGNNSRYPVYEENIDNIIGVIYLKDASLQMTFHNRSHIAICDIPDLIREVNFVPETRSIDTLFQFMRARKVHMVMIVDEYGQTSGLVTMEDILEEIVGSILDEYDDEDEFIQHQFDNSIIMDGLTPLDQVEEVLGVSFGDEEVETLNGYLTSLLEHVPTEEDQEVTGSGFRFEILSVDHHIIQKVRVEKMPVKEEEESCQDIQNSQT